MKWDEHQVEARTAEEIEQAKTPSGMRQRIFYAAYSDPLIGRVLDLARRNGLSGEDTYVLLAYHALCVKQRYEADRLEDLQTQVNPPLLINKKEA